MSKHLKGTFMLLLAALIWGSTFVAQDVGVDLIGPFTFQAIRQIMGFIVLLPVILLRNSANKDPGKNENRKNEQRMLLGYGALCGLVLFFACNLQQFGLIDTTAGKSGFITALYIVLVPIVGTFFGKKGGIGVWAAVIFSVIGLYFLCINGDSFAIGKGELLTLLCAFCFTAHILVIDYASPKVDGVTLSALQFLFSGLISLVFMILTETVVWKDVLACWLPICYAGILSCGVAYTLQIVAQRDTNPTVASITMSTESVFAVLSGWIVLNQKLTPRELFGCILMFAGVILAQLPNKKIKKEKAIA